MTMLARDTPKRLLGMAWKRLLDFCAVEGDATCLWTRWIVLRAVGLVYVLIFAGIIVESEALLGPEGITPLPDTLAALSKQYQGTLEALFRAPSLFWLSASPAMVAALEWLGLAAAVAVVLNVWPRMALFICWLFFLSFVVLGGFFAQTAPDPLMLEVALLCIPLAPPGFRPGLAAGAAPRRIAVFALRWMLFRLMLEAGLSKFVFGNELWRNLTVMDVMYETTPFPTFLGYCFHQLPHAFHLFEIAVTFAAEIIAPVLMVFGGRRGRWFAFLAWAALQVGIQATNNFGWLNVAAIGLCVIILDDQMLVSGVRRLGLRKLGEFLAARVTVASARAVRPWARWGLRVALGAQFALALFFYLFAPARIPIETLPRFISEPVVLLFGSFRSANAYPLFGSLLSERFEVEFVGSNDGGETWRSYAYRYKVQRVDRICPFIAPWYPRFEAILQNAQATSADVAHYRTVAALLIQREPAVLRLFGNDPFTDRPATMVRTPTYRFTYTDLRTFLATGHYWRKQYEGDYAPMMYANAQGEILASE